MTLNISVKKRICILLILMSVLAVCITGCKNQGTSVEETHVDATPVETVKPSSDSEEISSEVVEPEVNGLWNLRVPTQITKVGDFYFIVDCYNNKVLYNTNLEDPIYWWSVMTRDIVMGHTVASDGEVYLVDDTENNRILVFEYNGQVFVNTQVFENIGNRPHFIVYNEEDKNFYAWSSMTGQMYVFAREEGTTEMYLSRIMTIDELNGVYVRSFTIEGDSIFLVSGNKQIIEVRLDDFKIMNRYPVPDSMAGMVQIMPVDKGYYITISTDANGNQDFATMIFTESLENLEKGEYTDIYSNFQGGGTPYYMGEIDGRYYLTEHRLPDHAIWSFDIGEDGLPTDVVAVY